MFHLPQILKEFIFLHLNYLLAHCCIFAHQTSKLYFHGRTKDADIILFALANIIHNKFVGHVWYMNFPPKFVIGNIKGVVNTKWFLIPLPLKDQDPVFSQYHGCWCPGDVRSQGISSHDIELKSRMNTFLLLLTSQQNDLNVPSGILYEI